MILTGRHDDDNRWHSRKHSVLCEPAQIVVYEAVYVIHTGVEVILTDPVIIRGVNNKDGQLDVFKSFKIRFAYAKTKRRY